MREHGDLGAGSSPHGWTGKLVWPRATCAVSNTPTAAEGPTADPAASPRRRSIGSSPVETETSPSRVRESAEYRDRPCWAGRGWTLLAAAAAVVVLASGVLLGADTMWLVALGEIFLHTGHLPVGLPFAAADPGGWAAVPALGGLLLAALHRLGPLGLPAAQLAVDLVLLLLLGHGARRLAASDGATAAVMTAFVVGAAPALLVVRAQLLSFVPFALLVMLLRAESQHPSRRVWWLVPLIAVWGDLHGAVLVGVAASGCYLVARRWRHSSVTAAGVLFGLFGALLLNPAGLRTPAYYYGVLTNETARRGILLWAPPQWDAPFDLLLLGSSALLLGLAAYARRPLWEYLALAGLATATASAARNGIWLGIFTVAPAAAGLTRLLAHRRPRRARSATPSRARELLPAALATASVTLLGMAPVVLVGRAQPYADPDDTARAISQIAMGRTVLAPEPLAESLAAAGARVWISDPLDAFTAQDQGAYLDFLLGKEAGARRALDAADLVVALHGSVQAELAVRAGYTPSATVAGYDIDTRTPVAAPMTATGHRAHP